MIPLNLTPSPQGKEQGMQEGTRKRYMEETIEEIRGRFPQKKGAPFLKTLLITHADQYHYNLIPDIFSATRGRCPKIGTLILSGFQEDYSEDFQKWIHNYKKHITKTLFTGRYDGGSGERKEIGFREDGLARAYFSGMPHLTETEEQIDAALAFSSEEDAPKLDILSMNAGHATEPSGLVRIANTDKNTNSLVLRLQAAGRSFLFAGDAEEGTWNHVRANFYGKENDLETTYLLVSHHGSAQNGATRKDILELLKPKACFLSVGRHKKYHHPHENTLTTLLSLPSLLETDTHVVSYYAREKEEFFHKRRHLNQAIFSTLNHGTLSMTLREEGDEEIVDISSYKEKIYETKGRQPEKFSVDYDNVYCVKEKKSLEQALLEFEDYCKQYDMKGLFWEPDKADKIIIRSKRKPLNPDGTEETHILINTDRKRFYFLEKLEDEPIAITQDSIEEEEETSASYSKKRKNRSSSKDTSSITFHKNAYIIG